MSASFADRCMDLLIRDELRFVIAYWLMVPIYTIYDILFVSHPRTYVDRLCSDGRVWRFYNVVS